MKRKLFNTKDRRGQVFLLLATVILIYLILISTTVYQITQSPYVNPAPNQKQLMNYIDNSISSFHELSEIALSQYSQGLSRVEIIPIIQLGIIDIEEYLDEHNLPSTVTLDEDSLGVYNSSTSVNPVYTHFECNISILIDSLDLYYSASFSLYVDYYMEISEISGTANYIYLYKIQNNIKSLINDGELIINPSTQVSNLGDGSFQADLQTGQTIAVAFENGILLWMEI